MGPGAGRGGGRRRRRRRRRRGPAPRGGASARRWPRRALLCRLAETLEGAHLGDTHRRPKVKAEATHNINKALAVFRRARARRATTPAVRRGPRRGGREERVGCALRHPRRVRRTFEKGSSKKNAFEKNAGCAIPRARPRPARHAPRGRARGVAYGDPRDVTAAEAGEGRLPRTPAPFRERNIFSDVSVSPTSAPKAGASAGAPPGAAPRPAQPLTARGLPSPLARARGDRWPPRARRVARLMGDADRAEKMAKTPPRRRRRGRPAAATRARLSRLPRRRLSSRLRTRRRPFWRWRTPRAQTPPSALSARRCGTARRAHGSPRGGAVQGAIARRDSARGFRAPRAPRLRSLGYVSPNENARASPARSRATATKRTHTDHERCQADQKR